MSTRELSVALLVERGKVADLERRLNQAMIQTIAMTEENVILKGKNAEL